jgi:hypothetical protein
VSAADHLREAIAEGCTRDDHDHVGDHRAEVLDEAAGIVRALIPPNPDGNEVDAAIGYALELAAQQIEATDRAAQTGGEDRG